MAKLNYESAGTDVMAGSLATKREGGGVIGSGEMADRIRNCDWSRAAVGAMEFWPESLRITVNMMIACPQPMFLWWGPQLIQFYNDAYRRLLRADKHPKALGQRGEECWPEIWDVIGSQIDAVMLNGKPTFQRNQLIPIERHGALEDVYWSYSYSPIFDSNGSIRGTLVVCSETTEEVIDARRLRRSENRFRRLIEEANVGVVISDMRGHLRYLNPATLELLGYTRDDIDAGMLRCEALLPDEFAGDVKHATQKFSESGGTTAYEKVYFAKDGRKIPLLADPTLLVDMEGGEPELALFLADLSPLRRVEHALLQNEKLAAVGRLASSIAHEINNPLEAVTNLLFLVEAEVESEEAKGFIKAAQGELARVANITTHTLRFHRQSTNPAMATKAEILNEVLTLFRGRLSTGGIKVETRYSTVPPTLCYNGDLRQLFANLIANAADACPRGGKICLRERVGRDLKTGRKGIRVSISDNGSGMSKETIRHIFEPFFTTKEATGNGLGLWVSAGILEKHGARVTVRSNQDAADHGTVFALWFPLDGVSNKDEQGKNSSGKSAAAKN